MQKEKEEWGSPNKWQPHSHAKLLQTKMKCVKKSSGNLLNKKKKKKEAPHPNKRTNKKREEAK